MFFGVRDQAHLLHWQTKSYAEHKALGAFYEGWIDLVDDFVETYQGRYSRIEGGVTITTQPYSEGFSARYLEEIAKYLQNDARRILNPTDTDLHNILDEMKGLVNKTLYLLSLK